MTRANYNIAVILLSFLGISAYLFFLDVKDMAYVSSPSVISAGDVQVELELTGTQYPLLGRFRKEISSPYKANLYFESDIPVTNVFLREFKIKSNLTGKEYVYHNDPAKPIKISFEPKQVGVEAFYDFEEFQPLEFNEKDILVGNLNFDIDISGLRESHQVEFNLVPKIRRTRKILLPEDARKELEKR